MLVKVEEMFGDKLCPPPPQDAVCVCNLILSKIKRVIRSEENKDSKTLFYGFVRILPHCLHTIRELNAHIHYRVYKRTVK